MRFADKLRVLRSSYPYEIFNLSCHTFTDRLPSSECLLKATLTDIETRKSGLRKAVYRVTERKAAGAPQSYIVTVKGHDLW